MGKRKTSVIVQHVRHSLRRKRTSLSLFTGHLHIAVYFQSQGTGFFYQSTRKQITGQPGLVESNQF